MNLPIVPAVPSGPISVTSLQAALSVTHTGSTNGLSEGLVRQARHIAYEFILLKEDRVGPNSEDTGLAGLERVAQRLDEYFDWRLEERATQEDLLGEAREAEETLREIRCLQDSEHFFSEPLRLFFNFLTLLSPDFNYFGNTLFRELKEYRKNRDAEEDRFLAPFHTYRDQVIDIINDVRDRHSFREFSLEDRIKRGLLKKLTVRVWKHMQEFYDLVGLRIIVGNQKEVDAAVALVEGAFKVHESSAMLDEGVSHYFRVAETETKDNERGYRAKHINIRRECRDNGPAHPTAEIQVMSRGIKNWGDIQRRLIYKDDGIPEEVKSVINAYCRSCADYIVVCEAGGVSSQKPDLRENILILNQIEDTLLRSDVLDRLCDMDSLASKYQKEARKRSEGVNGQASANTSAPR